MGWDFCRTMNKKDTVAMLTARGRVKAHKVVKNTLWTVEEYEGVPFIGCYLLAYSKKSGAGYKDMCESLGPYYYDCPLAFLDMAPVACAEWREKVRYYHAKEAALRVGATVKLVPGCRFRGQPVETAKVVSTKPFLVLCGNTVTKLSRKYIEAVA